jgi:hypothetical protein
MTCAARTCSTPARRGTTATRPGQRYVAIGAIEPKFYAELIERLGLAGEALPDQHDRAGWPALRARLAAVFATKTRDEWCRVFEGSDACFAPVLTFSEATGIRILPPAISHVTVGAITPARTGAALFANARRVRRAPPERRARSRGAGRRGFADDEIERLRALGLGFQTDGGRQASLVAARPVATSFCRRRTVFPEGPLVGRLLQRAGRSRNDTRRRHRSTIRMSHSSAALGGATLMRLSLRFLIPLLVALGIFAYAAVPLVDSLTTRWFVRDLDMRSNLIANTIQEPLEDLIKTGSRAHSASFNG